MKQILFLVYLTTLGNLSFGQFFGKSILNYSSQDEYSFNTFYGYYDLINSPTKLVFIKQPYGKFDEELKISYDKINDSSLLQNPTFIKKEFKSFLPYSLLKKANVIFIKIFFKDTFYLKQQYSLIKKDTIKNVFNIDFFDHCDINNYIDNYSTYKGKDTIIKVANIKFNCWIFEEIDTHFNDATLGYYRKIFRYIDKKNLIPIMTKIVNYYDNTFLNPKEVLNTIKLTSIIYKKDIKAVKYWIIPNCKLPNGLPKSKVSTFVTPALRDM